MPTNIARLRFVLGSSLLALAPLTPLFVPSLHAEDRVHIPQDQISYEEHPRVSLPLVICWHDGKKNLYIQTEASDQGVAEQQGVNYVPQLSNAIDAPGGAVDDLYMVTNSTQKDQYNILPSEPKPVGPKNTDPSYTPLWQVSQVTWNDGVQPYTLKSEKEVLDAAKQGLVSLVKTRIVVNCPIVYTDAGGLLPNAVVHFNDHDGDDGSYRNRAH